MSKEFIEKRVGNTDIELARRQQRQLSYYTQSKIHPDSYNSDYWDNWNYNFSDDLLDFVCNVFKNDNFKRFAQFIQYPLPTAKIVKQRIKPELERVFHAEDSFFSYFINNESVHPEQLESKKFGETLFNKILFNYNDLIVHDLSGVNKATRYFVSIDNVIALRSSESTIHEVAFTASVEMDGGLVDGYAYMNANEYIFYDKDFKLEPIVKPHDLGKTPVIYVSSSAFKDKDIVRQSIFSELREELHEYAFLKVLQRMVEPKGSLPISTKVQTKEVPNNDVIDSSNTGTESNMAASRIVNIDRVKPNSSLLDAGTEIGVPAVRKQDGSVDSALAANFINFFYLPVEAMTYVKDRIKEIESNIITITTGDFFEPNQSSQNELQISKGYISRQDKLRHISGEMTIASNKSDWLFLALEKGKDSVVVDGFYGSDFFIETQQDIYNMIEKSPNPIESKSLLVRLAKSRSRFNQRRGQRDTILYSLLPYAVNSDFDKAIEKGVDTLTFQYQTRFNYWISLFEAKFGDIVMFWDGFGEKSNSEIFLIINNLIIHIINEELNSKTESIPASDGDEGASL